MRKLLSIASAVLLGVVCAHAISYTPMNGNWVKMEYGTETVTNGEAITYENPLMILTASGQASGYTNTITIANPTEIGVVLCLYVADASSNLVGIADSGNCNLSAAFAGDDDDSLTLIATATNEWSEVSRSAN